jgi:alpha-glucuronidase
MLTMSIEKALAPLMRVLPLSPVGGTEEDGYDLWLRYRALDGDAKAALRAHARAILLPGLPSLTVLAALAELHRALHGLLGTAPPLAEAPGPGDIVLATPESLPALGTLGLRMAELGAEGYVVRRMVLDGRPATLIAANADIGLLYGTFAWLRRVAAGADPATVDERSAPRLRHRVLNHWDNLDRTVERGYAGESIWDWWALPHVLDARYVDYARACASLGINGASLNNVNARAEMLTAPWIAKAAALADVFRPYGIRVYLSVRFSAPVELREVATADPLDDGVRAWWKRKADEIYRVIPDFGGFVVKANSEGQPGPQDYARSHAEGANLLAEALAPHGGTVMWRAFVYSQHNPVDRARQAFDEFKPLDGQFAPGVVVQVKNGPIDFQPREPFHPLFGAMPKTPLVLEFQITKEYLGFSTHIAYLGTMWEEVLRSDTAGLGVGPTVAQTLQAVPGSGIAGVANIGSGRTWCGSHFDAANWYAFGRLAWDPDLGAHEVAAEWARLTFGTEPALVDTVVAMLMASREAVVDYMMPLGLHHLFDTGHHHGPGPWVDDLKRADWNPVYYHQADAGGIGFDRSVRGSGAVAQYAPALAERWGRPETTPPELLLWFHHLPWHWRLADGRTLWEALVARYDRGVAAAEALREQWRGLEGRVDARRWRDVETRLAVQVAEAHWWRDACLVYFQSRSGLPLPPGTRAPSKTLDDYRRIEFHFAPGRG